MSFKSIIKKQVRNSFKLLGDLATTVTLQERNSTSFDFATQTTNMSPLVSITTKGIFSNTTKQASQDENPTVTAKLVVAVDDISNPDMYDKVIVNGVTWNIIPPCVDNGFTYTLPLVKEA